MCGVLRDPVLRALTGASRTASLGTAPGLEIKKTRVEHYREIRQIRNKNEIRNTYPDRALILRFLVAVFRARGIVLSLEDCPEAAPLVSARWLDDEGLLRCLAGRALLRVPASSPSVDGRAALSASP